jgi:hypothetical protein
METIQQKVIRLRGLGLSYEDIASEVPCAVSTVWYYLTPGAMARRKALSRKDAISRMDDLRKYYGGKCRICGYCKCLKALDFHHMGHEDKTNNVSALVNQGQMTKAKAEAAKCILICSNCHREVHAGVTEVVISSGIAPASAG